MNRLFIVVGVLAILAIIAGFVAPLFVDWSAYRTRLEAIASEALGQEVHVRGEFDVGFLPQPRIRLNQVAVGPPDAPIVEIAKVVAEFSLMDFLRDHYSVTKLELLAPRVKLHVDDQGQFSSIVQLPEAVSTTNISVEDADIVDGALLFADLRAGDTWEVKGINGTLQMGGLRGPFSLQGAFGINERQFDGRVSTSPISPQGALQTSMFARPRDGRFSVALEGLAETQGQLHFDGGIEVKYGFEQAEDVAGVRGDMIFTSNLKASSTEVLFSDVLVLPDENRPAARLSGSGQLALGAERSFDAVISGGVVSFGAPPSLTGEGDGRYGLAQMLAELPAPYLPAFKGHVAIDMTELDLHALTLRGLKMNAQSTGDGWDITNLTARMAGNTKLSMAGQLGAEGTQPSFDGTIDFESTRLDGFASQWRKAEKVQALLNVPGALSGRMVLGEGLLSVSDGVLNIGGATAQFGLELTKGLAPDLSITAQLGRFDVARSQMLMALLPGFEDGPEWAGDFGSVTFDIDAKALDMWDLGAQDVQLAGRWASEQLTVERFAAADWGGMTLDTSLGLAGGLAQPVINGSGSVRIADRESVLAAKLLDALKTPEETKVLIGQLSPLAMRFNLSPGDDDAQVLRLEGQAGALAFDGQMGLSKGLLRVMQAPVQISMVGQIDDPTAAAAQFGLPDLPIAGGAPLQIDVQADGSTSNSLDMRAKLFNDDENLSYAGSLIVVDPAHLRGKGKLEFALQNIAPAAALFGAEAVGFGGISGTADLSLGATKLSLSNMDAALGDAHLSGNMERTRRGESDAVSGILDVSSVEVMQLAGLLGGIASIAVEGEVWPDGPFALAESGRSTRGQVHVTSADVRHGGEVLAQKAAFDVSWDGQGTRLRDFVAEMGGGKIEFDANLCCHSNLADRQANGRVVLTGVALDALLPEAAAGIEGMVDVGLQFSSSGASFAEQMAAMTGEGSFSIRDLRIGAFSPSVFDGLADNQQILALDEAALEEGVRQALAAGPFVASNVDGVFSIAGGSVRIANVVAENDRARMIGGINLGLDDLALEGRWTMNPGADAQARSAEVTSLLSGSLTAPVHTFDLAPMIDEVKFRAYEQEVELLEAAKAEQDARAAETQKQRALMRAEQAKQFKQTREEEEARQAAEAEAARKAADEEATKRAAEEEARKRRAQQKEQALDLLSEDPSVPPQVNQINPNFKLPEVTFSPQRQF